MITNLIYDFGKVLVTYDFRDYIATIVKDRTEREALYGILCDQEFANRCDRGESSLEVLFSEMQTRYPQWSDQIREFNERQLEVVTGEMPGMSELLDKLHGQGFKLYGLTNWSKAVYRVIEKYPIFRKLDGWVISSEEKLLKPESSIYLRLCEKFSIKPQDCLFADDKIVNVEGARAAGMSAVVFTDCENYEKNLLEYTDYKK